MSETTQIMQREQSQPAAPRTSLPAAVTPEQLLMTAIDRGASMEQLEKLIELKERWERNEARKAFDAAIAAARREIKPIIKTAEVNYQPQGKAKVNYMHETLDAIASQIDPILSEHGLSYRFRPKQEGGNLHVTCVIAHRDGHSEESTLCGPPDTSGGKGSYQSIGSAATYLQRYTLKLALGLSAAKDDDGQQTQQQPTAQQQSADGFVTLDQVNQLRKQARRAGLGDDFICQKAHVKAVEDITQSRFSAALNYLTKYADRVEATGGDHA